MINNGKAMYISPPITIPINITGKKITVQSNFIIPQDAFNPNIKNFPTNQIIQIVNNNDNIFLLLLKLILICVFHFFCSFSDKYSDVFFIPSLLLNAGFFSIFSIIRINRILCAASIWSPHLYSAFCWYCHYNKFIFHNTHPPWGIAILYFSNFENSVFIFLCTNCFRSMLTHL